LRSDARGTSVGGTVPLGANAVPDAAAEPAMP
jgi:hypothetical protein